MKAEHTQKQEKPAAGRSRLVRCRVGLSLVVLAVASHAWWLRVFGTYLCAEEPLPAADVAIVLSGDHRHRRASEMWKAGAVSEIWVLEREANYAVSAGILPPEHMVDVDQLEQFGVPTARIRVLDGGMRDVDDAARMIARAVIGSPETNAVVLCEEMHCRNLGLVLDRVAKSLSRPRIGIVGIPDDRFDSATWWKSRTGWKVAFNAISEVLFTVIHGVDAERMQAPWDAAEFERKFVLIYGGTGCQDPQ